MTFPLIFDWQTVKILSLHLIAACFYDTMCNALFKAKKQQLLQ